MALTSTIRTSVTPFIPDEREHRRQLANWIRNAHEGRQLYQLSASTGTSSGRTIWEKLDEVVSIKDFGAKGDGVALDTTAIQAAVSSGFPAIFAPAGTYNIGNISIPATVKTFFGTGEGTKFVATGSLSAFVPLMYFNALSGFSVHNFALDVSAVTYSSVHAIQFGTCKVGNVFNIHEYAGGFIGIYAPACEDVNFDNIAIDTAANIGFVADTIPQRLHLTNLRVGPTSVGHAIQIQGGNQHIIANCYVNLPEGFGINYLSCADSLIVGNTCIVDRIEGINIQDSNKITIANNLVYANASHSDFAISIFASSSSVQHCLIANNRTYFNGKSGIALAASSTQPCKQNHVIGNFVVSPNQLNESMGAAVLLYGSTLCTENTVQGNRLIDEGSTAKYVVNEWNDGNGNPGSNFMIYNPVITAAGLVRQNNPLTSTTRVWDCERETFVPTITAGGGSLGSVSATGSFCRRGEFVDVAMTINIVSNSTGAVSIVATTPLTTFSRGVLNGRETNVAGVQLQGIGDGGTSISIFRYDNAYPGTNGARLVLSGILELS